MRPWERTAVSSHFPEVVAGQGENLSGARGARNGTGQARRLLGAIRPCDHGNAPPCRRIFQKWWLDKARTCPAPEGPGARQAGPLLNPNRSQSQVGAYSYDPLGKSGPQLTDFACWWSEVLGK
jgi:hypothetical protein